MFDEVDRVAAGPDVPDPAEGDDAWWAAAERDAWSAAEMAERDAWLAAESAEWAAIRQAGGPALPRDGDVAIPRGGDESMSNGERGRPWWAGLEPGAGLGSVLAGVDVPKLGDFDLVEFVTAVERQRRHLDGVFAGAVAALAGRPVFEQCADCDPDAPDAELTPHGKQGHDPRVAAADEVSPALGWTPRYATSQVEQAVDLATLLPATLAALRAGRIDAYRARIIWEQTQAVADRPGLRAQVEAAGLAVAGSKTAPALREYLKRKLAALDPAAAERRRKAARRSREASKPRPDCDGMASMAIYGPIEDLAAFWTALDAAARARQDAAAKNASHPDAGVGLAALRFDVLADLGYAALACGHLGCCNPDCAGTSQRLGTRQGKQANVTVRMGVGTAAGIDSLPAVVEGFGTITAEAARAFAADATWRRLLTDPVTGTLLDYGRTTYAPPQPLRAFVVARDGTCRFPTCAWPADSSDLDHQPAWSDGGQTRPEGLIALHRRHHNSKTHHGWQIEQPAPGVLIWRTPTGHTYPADPEIVDLLTDLTDPNAPPGDQGAPGDPDPPHPDPDVPPDGLDMPAGDADGPPF